MSKIRVHYRYVVATVKILDHISTAWRVEVVARVCCQAGSCTVSDVVTVLESLCRIAREYGCIVVLLYRASAWLCVQSAILLWHIRVSVCPCVTLWYSWNRKRSKSGAEKWIAVVWTCFAKGWQWLRENVLLWTLVFWVLPLLTKLPRRIPSVWALNTRGVGRNCDFRQKSLFIWEMVRDRPMVAEDHNLIIDSRSIRVGSSDLEWHWNVGHEGSSFFLEDFHNYGLT